MGLTPEQVAEYMSQLARRAKPLMLAGPDPTGTEYFLIVGKDPRLVGPGSESVVGLNRLQALNIAAQIIGGFAAEAVKAGSAEFVRGVKTGIKLGGEGAPPGSLKLEN